MHDVADVDHPNRRPVVDDEVTVHVDVAGRTDTLGCIGKRHAHERADRVESTTMLVGELVRCEPGNDVDVTTDRSDESGAIDGRAGKRIERHSLRWRPSDVHAHTDDDETVDRRRLRENSRNLRGTDDEVVRPLEANVDTGNFVRRPRRAKCDDPRHPRNVTRLLPTKEDRHEHVRTARRVPTPVEAAPAGGLMIGDENQPIRGAAACTRHEIVVGAARFADVFDRPGGKPRLGR